MSLIKTYIIFNDYSNAALNPIYTYNYYAIVNKYLNIIIFIFNKNYGNSYYKF